ncbi:hypothetical protein VNI00_013341 [Paramarasmius palmivorus]|uniref:FAS1 domain-containing protein n=1 Tax=Paramarasmius palmivorus TaxID=297713 RepID=A0AAW0BZ69_9AGAR
MATDIVSNIDPYKALVAAVGIFVVSRVVNYVKSLQALLSSPHYTKVYEYGRRLSNEKSDKLVQKTINFDEIGKEGGAFGDVDKWDVLFDTLHEIAPTAREIRPRFWTMVLRDLAKQRYVVTFSSISSFLTNSPLPTRSGGFVMKVAPVTQQDMRFLLRLSLLLVTALLAAAGKDFSKLRDGRKQHGLTSFADLNIAETQAGKMILSQLSKGTNFSIFAPTNAALSKLSSNTTMDTELVAILVSYHITQGNYYYSDSHG